ncbi:E3 ubiquitin-protein ligase rnf8 isoform X2 [Phycodurus eques]|uniref:E3 ubiquitin-protein ligase rnf8 isoform X2 n=1 Tax=Phycodurus eques TaxID=693459 RepID=UPI002ACE6EFD|nr:E3 ubiquitin-protein ligase rnf8 isoform X2 [Phycodurus eques]
MDKVTTDSSVTAEEEGLDSEVTCLMRVDRNSDWLRLLENTEVTIGRGFDVTYQLLSPSCPLMISRLHCTFSKREDGHWTVRDNKSLNGVWVNGIRIPAQEAHLLKLGDSIQLGVPVMGSKVEYDYMLVRRSLREIKHNLAKRQKEASKAVHIPKKSKRKLTGEEMEPSTSKAKLYRCSYTDKPFAHPCPFPPAKYHQRRSCPQLEETATNPCVEEAYRSWAGVDVPCDLDNLQMYSQNILMLREQVDSTQRQVASLEAGSRSVDPFREEQIKELQRQLQTLRAKMQQMETLERSFSETKRQQEAQKTQQQKEMMKKQLDGALQERKIMDELALSRRRFEEILLAKNKELEVTKEEKEKAKAQKEEVVTQVTEVLENELQCIICSELFIEAVILNCAHSFCCHCIKQWRKKKEECPICRQAIKSQTRCLALDNCIDSMVENLSLEMKARRQTLISERKGEILAAASPAHVRVSQDEESSSSDSSSNGSSSTDSVETTNITLWASRRLRSSSSHHVSRIQDVERTSTSTSSSSSSSSSADSDSDSSSSEDTVEIPNRTQRASRPLGSSSHYNVRAIYHEENSD